jgi:hypothetical protein
MLACHAEATPSLCRERPDGCLIEQRSAASPPLGPRMAGDQIIPISCPERLISWHAIPETEDYRLSFLEACVSRRSLNSQCGWRCSIQSRIRERPALNRGTSSASSARPSGNIQNPKIGRKPKRPQQVRSTPVGTLIQTEDGRLSQRMIERHRCGSRSMMRSMRQSPTLVSAIDLPCRCNIVSLRFVFTLEVAATIAISISHSRGENRDTGSHASDLSPGGSS